MGKKYYDITVALAGICQSANLVQQFAAQGQGDQVAFTTLLTSITKINPDHLLDIFGHEANLKVGLEGVIYLLNSHRTAHHTEFTRYVLSLIMLARQLMKHQQAKTQLGNRIQLLCEHQLHHYDLMSDTVLHSLASIYSDIISPIGSKIQIVGSATFLSQPLVQDKIRATLLAGIRCAVLWQQMGGSKLQFLFSRKKLIEMATRLHQHC